MSTNDPMWRNPPGKFTLPRPERDAAQSDACTDIQYAPISAIEPIKYDQKSKPWRAALVRAAQIRDARDNLTPGSTLVQAALAQWDAACNGSDQARAAIADRLDGKPGQTVDIDVRVGLAELVEQSFKIAHENNNDENKIIEGEIIERNDQ